MKCLLRFILNVNIISTQQTSYQAVIRNFPFGKYFCHLIIFDCAKVLNILPSVYGGYAVLKCPSSQICEAVSIPGMQRAAYFILKYCYSKYVLKSMQEYNFLLIALYSCDINTTSKLTNTAASYYFEIGTR